jgi:S1-C subfamily serine protease
MRSLSRFVVRVVPPTIFSWSRTVLRLALHVIQAGLFARAVAVVPLVCMAASPVLAHAAEAGDLRNGVVQIESRSPEGKLRKGAGFIVSIRDGAVFIMTAAHVVKGDKTPQVEFFTRPLPVEASVAGQDLQLDIALLVVRGSTNLFEGLQPLPLGLGW